MRELFGPKALAFLALLFFFAAAPPKVQAQGRPPPGSYQQQCRDVRMNGQFLSAWCRGPRGSGESSINVMSCGSDIGVDLNGGLICAGPGAGGERPPPGVYPPPGGGYYPPSVGRPWSATLYDKRGFRGRSVVVSGDTPNLDYSGFNDRVRSIRFDRRSGPWLVCTNAGYRGSCTTLERSISDTAQIGMWDSISSLRPLR